MSLWKPKPAEIHRLKREQGSLKPENTVKGKPLRKAEDFEIDALADDSDSGVESGSDDEDGLSYRPIPGELDEPIKRIFSSGESVWVKASSGEWYQGKISGHARIGDTREGEGLWYSVIFSLQRTRIKKFFAPLNGDIKPDTQHTRNLLEYEGWIYNMDPGC